MDDVKTQPPPNRQIANYALTVAPVRYVKLASELVLLYAADVCQVLGSSPEELAVVGDENGGYVPIYEGTNLVEPLVLTVAGVRQLVDLESTPERERFATWVETELVPHRTGHRAPNPSRTKWGWQPIRDLVRERGYTARRFTEEANALELNGVDRFNQGNYIAWAYGGCLPAESLVTRACNLLNVDPTELFNADVLAAYPNRGKGRRRPAGEVAGG